MDLQLSLNMAGYIKILAILLGITVTAAYSMEGGKYSGKQDNTTNFFATLLTKKRLAFEMFNDKSVMERSIYV